MDNPQAAYELCSDYVPDCNQPLPTLRSSNEEVNIPWFDENGYSEPFLGIWNYHYQIMW